MERRFLDKYQIKDNLGYGADTPYGIFRPLEVVEGHLTFAGVSDKARRMREEAAQIAAKEKAIADSFFDTPRRRGRPRNHG